MKLKISGIMMPLLLKLCIGVSDSGKRLCRGNGRRLCRGRRRRDICSGNRSKEFFKGSRRWGGRWPPT